MARKQFRGVEKHQELGSRNEWRDIRSFSEKLREQFERGDAIIYVGAMSLALMWFMPTMMELIAAIAAFILLWASNIKFSLPFRMPATSNLPDPNSLSPKDGRPEQAKGIAFLGNDIQTDKELWFTNDDMRTHILVFGSTGAGKTETLISMAFNTLIHGSGFIYVDGKGDNGLWAKIYSIARSLGREDDLLVINYMTGGRDVFGPQKTKLSNTMNPFITGSAGGLTEMLVSLMDESGGDNAMWQGRAISLVSAIMFALVYLRDNNGLLLDVDVIREHLILDNIQKLAKRRDLPNMILQSVRAYLRSLPGYKENPPGGQQGDTALDQHGYLQMQFTKILGSLSDTYGYIFRTNLGEVDFFDVVLNRRILVVLLPAMEKAPAELGNLGKIIVAGLKQMMATGLGDILEGDYADVIEVKPTNSPAPFMCILDEYGYYVVKGASVMPAQARSLGFCMVFAGQDYPAFKKNNMAEEAISTIGNCNIKIFMKTEDPTETTELFEKSVGQALVSRTTGFAQNQGILRNSYVDQNNASLDRRARGDVLDLKDQGPGEAHIIFKSTLVRAKMFYADAEPAAKLKVNSFLRVEPPEREEMVEFDNQITELSKRLLDPELSQDYIDEAGLPAKLELFRQAFTSAGEQGASLPVAGIAAIASAARQAYANLDAFGRSAKALEEEDEDEIHAFSDPDDMDDFELDEDIDGDGSDILMDATKTRERLTDLEMASGATPQDARENAERLRADMQAISSYPQHVPDAAEPGDVISIIQELGDDIESGGKTTG
jgi:intracellular multiplication protein IcmO